MHTALRPTWKRNGVQPVAGGNNGPSEPVVSMHLPFGDAPRGHECLRCPIYSGQGPPSRIGDDLNGELVSSKRGSYSPEFKEAAVREVIDQSRPIADVARRLGLVEQTLGTWVKAFRAEHVGEAESELPVSVRARVKELEREVRELRMENEFLGKSVAFFAKKFR